MIALDDCLDVIDGEYLHGFVDGGGAAVKFGVVPDEAAAASFSKWLGVLGEEAGYAVARVDAATTRVHLLEQVFFEVARQVDWDGLAAVTARRALEDAGYPAPPENPDASLDQTASYHGVDARELKREVDRSLQRRVYRDYSMVGEFRIAMLRLCQARLRTGQVAEAEHAAVLDWLKGDLARISALKSALIFRKIARHNARQMLFSLAHWLSVNDHAGLVLVLDVRRLGLARRPSPEERQGNYYTKGALLDAYEVMRQLVDNTDELAHCFVAVIAAPELLTDHNRGLDAYQALKLRIFDEVRDRHRDNPFSSLLRLGPAANRQGDPPDGAPSGPPAGPPANSQGDLRVIGAPDA
ncbi:MAG: BREX system ATP-binding domain-containing protein [Acidimicrobiales bacterium]